jgi:hypothetical protein
MCLATQLKFVVMGAAELLRLSSKKKFLRPKNPESKLQRKSG